MDITGGTAERERERGGGGGRVKVVGGCFVFQ